MDTPAAENITPPYPAPTDPAWVRVGKAFGKKAGMVQGVANLVGVLFISFYFSFLDRGLKTHFSLMEDVVFSLFLYAVLVLIGYVLYHRWYQGLGRYIRLKSRGEPVDQLLEIKAQKKVLNLPFVTSAVSMVNWTLAAFVVTTTNFLDKTGAPFVPDDYLNAVWLFSGIIYGGIITAATIFFVMENYCRKYLHHFFPKGGLVNVNGVLRLNLKLRIMITFVFASFIPIIDVALMSYSKARMMVDADPAQVLSSLGLFITFALAVDLSLAFLLSHLLAQVIVDPVTEMKTAMARVAKGDLDAGVKVCDNNELGILGNHFNKMTEGLRDRYHMRHSLALARDVQQDLLPKTAPAVDGLDIAGKIIYSDETGGDYYDYIHPIDPASQKIGIVIGDVSEHGIPSAILMASTRAFIRQRAALEGDMATLITDVNFQFSRDVEDSGRFMTLFFLSVEFGDNILRWVRAGHDAAIFYDPVTDTFEELKGKGMALGISREYEYDESVKYGFEKGQIIIMATDGLWEAVNPEGEMFGRDRIKDVVREYSRKGASEIKQQILSHVDAFSQSRVPEDDITLVVVKHK